MTEHISTRRKVREYVSPFDDLDPNKILEYETLRGTVANIIKDLKTALPIVISDFQKGIHNPDSPIHIPIYNSSELMKMAVTQKVDIDRRKMREDMETAIKAIKLSTDVAVACFSRDKSALRKVRLFEAFIRNSSLKKMLEKTVNEAPDPGIMPDHPGEEDAKLASELKSKTGGRSILAIILGDRGLRRGLNVFLDYQADSNTPDSEPWPIRFSVTRMDRVPNLAVPEIDLLQKMARGRQIALIGPQDRIGLAEHYFNNIGFRTNGDPGTSVIPVPLGIRA